ncbi:MAG: GGDEF and EAL domain-containing protein [Gammaproteobacteria bacterium]|nr:GGDEF and EAL domain-containing protein [Gammaproteobacteria bacterium]
MLLYFILIVLTITFGYLFFIRNNELKELQKYAATLENDLLHQQIKFEEVSQQSGLNSQISFDVTADALTGLPSPQVFEDRALQTFHLSKRFGKIFGILSLEVSDIDEIKDKLGEESTNKLFKEITSRLKGSIRLIDTISRQNNTFILLLAQLTEPEAASYVANRILSVIDKPFIIDNNTFSIKMNIGVSIYPIDGDNVSTLMENAHKALEKSKSTTAHSFYFHNEDIQDKSNRVSQIASIFHKADFLNQIVVYCIPQVNSTNDKVEGVKVLPYLQDSELGLLAFDEFNKISERENKNLLIFEYVLHKAIIQFKHWQVEGISPQRLAINVSGKLIQDETFISKLIYLLEETGFQPNFLALEIAADNFAENATSLQNAFLKISDLGVQTSIGIFSLGHLVLQKVTQLPINYLKVDDRLISSLTTYTNNENTLSMLMELSKTMGTKIIAEGVDDEKQKVILQKIGFEVMEGKLFGIPKPIESFMK